MRRCQDKPAWYLQGKCLFSAYPAACNYVSLAFFYLRRHRFSRRLGGIRSFCFARFSAVNTSRGAWWLENKLDCSLPYEIDEFFDYAGYGESIAENNDGEFVEGLGFVCTEEGYAPIHVLQDMDRGMGGM